MSAEDEDHARDTALELALRSGLHTPAALTLDEQPSTPLRRENAFCVDSGAPSAQTSRAQSAQSTAVRSDAATLFGEELKEISSAHKKQCEQLALMRLAHVKQWLEQMESSLLRLERASRSSSKTASGLFEPHIYLSPGVMARLDVHISALTEAAMRSITTVALATSLLDECTKKEANAGITIAADLNCIRAAYRRVDALIKFCASHPEHRMSKKELEDAARDYYWYLGNIGSINASMEQLYVMKQHIPCFTDIMSQLLRADLLRRVLDGKDHRHEDAEDSGDDDEESDEDDATEEASD